MNLSLRESIDRKGAAIGTMLQDVRDPFVIQLVAAAGLDFVIIDTEHGTYDNERVADLVKLARALGVIPIVRVVAPTYEHLCPRLDAGARGLILPRIEDAEAVERAVRCTKYPPLGCRGFVSLKGQTDYVRPDIVLHIEESNAVNFVIPQIELAAALDNLDSILSVDGVDIAMVGPADLAVGLGHPGKMDTPDEIEWIENVIEACGRHGVAPGIHVGSIDSAVEWKKKGMRFVSCGADCGFLQAGFNEIAARLR
ncbi:aldolase [Candidatus Sumerlaeota bacterium]|nr:aldolase [Candidatus Sumerlaeota bacterium]